jgi:hypothetical protein
MRVFGTLRATEESEAGAPPSEDLMMRMGAFVQEAIDAGILVAADGLYPSGRGKRMRLKDGVFTVTDGPFTESRELVASFAIYEVKDMAEAEHWTRRFLEVLGDGECELRPIMSGPPSPA